MKTLLDFVYDNYLQHPDKVHDLLYNWSVPFISIQRDKRCDNYFTCIITTDLFKHLFPLLGFETDRKWSSLTIVREQIRKDGFISKDNHENVVRELNRKIEVLEAKLSSLKSQNDTLEVQIVDLQEQLSKPRLIKWFTP